MSTEQGVREAMLQVADGPAGSSYIQLLEPLGPDTPVGRFLARRGEGVHHIGYGVADITTALAAIGATGVRLIDARPRHGSMGAAIAFLHPSDVGGVLTELVQAPGRPDRPGSARRRHRGDESAARPGASRVQRLQAPRIPGRRRHSH